MAVDRGTEQVSFRIRREVSDQIRKIAEYEKRSVSNLINFVLEAWVEDRDIKFRKKYKIRGGRGNSTPKEAGESTNGTTGIV